MNLTRFALAFAVAMGIGLVSRTPAADPEPSALVKQVVTAVGGEDKLLKIFRLKERLTLGADLEKKGSERLSFLEPPHAWWVGKTERVKEQKEPAIFLVWAWTLGALTDPRSKLEAIPEITEADRPAFGLRVSGTIDPAMELYFDRKSNRLVRIDWRSDIHRFSDWKETDGVHYPAKCVGSKKVTGTVWYRTEILEIERLKELPKVDKPGVPPAEGAGIQIVDEKGVLTLKYSGSHKPAEVKMLVTDADLTALAQHPRIRDVAAIAFDGHMKLDGTGLAALGDMPRLKAVEFNGIAFKAVPFGPAGFDALAKMKGLEKVSFQHAVIPTAGAVTLLESLPNLQHFVAGSIADDAMLAAAAKAPNLRTLHFGHWATEPTRPLTAEGFAHYRKMMSLEKLVTGTVIPNDLDYAKQFAVLADMPKLNDLSFAFGIALSTPIKPGGLTLAPVVGKSDPKAATAADLTVLAKAPQLTSLRLTHGSLGSEALAPLVGCKSLRFLSFDGTIVPAADLTAFKSARPDVKVVIVDRTPPRN